jgi:hypothetical protein
MHLFGTNNHRVVEPKVDSIGFWVEMDFHSLCLCD